MLTTTLKRYPLSLLTALIIVILSLMPFPEIKMVENVPLADKWTHMVMYGGFCSVLWFEYYRLHNHAAFRRTLLLAILAPIVMSGTLELMQEYLTTSRSGEWMDLLANTIGVLLGALIGNTLCRPLGRHFSRSEN